MTLLYSIESCLKVTKQPASRFGREAVRDPRLVHDLRRGRQPGPAMERRVRSYIAQLLKDAHPTGADTGPSGTTIPGGRPQGRAAIAMEGR
jgi:hypothetical protein